MLIRDSTSINFSKFSKRYIYLLTPGSTWLSIFTTVSGRYTYSGRYVNWISIICPVGTFIPVGTTIQDLRVYTFWQINIHQVDLKWLVFGIAKFGESEVEIPPFWHQNLEIKKTVRKPLSLKQKPPSVFLYRKVFYAWNSCLSDCTSLVCEKWMLHGENRCLSQFTG